MGEPHQCGVNSNSIAIMALPTQAWFLLDPKNVAYL
jgi:hypothetical protein